jgi:methylthioribose-1-phosphate isomerase
MSGSTRRRPRNQGASLTAWELGKHGVPHTVIADNAGGHLMQRGQGPISCITGTDRTTRRGDVCNKIGTYLKALAAHDNGVPFYVGLPYPSIDWTIEDGRTIPNRGAPCPRGLAPLGPLPTSGEVVTIDVLPEGSPAANPRSTSRPLGLVTALITERGVCAASEAGLLSLYPEQAKAA